MQVSGRFLYLDKSIERTLAPCFIHRSHDVHFAQVTRLRFSEPCSRR
jgi:hypothetical protein